MTSVLSPADGQHGREQLKDASSNAAEALFKEARRRRQRRWALGTGILVLVVGLVGGVSASTTFGRPNAATHASPASEDRASIDRSVGPPPNLDVLAGGVQVSARLRSGPRMGSTKPAGPGVQAPIAFPRRGYVLAESVGGYESVSYDLQTVSFSWAGVPGSNPAPASNPGDIWLSDPSDQIGRAQEFDEYGRKVGSPVVIPSQSLVVGQTGPDLIVVTQSPPTGQPLLLWDPADQRVVATLGQFDQQVSTGRFVAWTIGNELYVDSPVGSRILSATGPEGDWATALALNPGGTKVAVVWAPRPGSAEATSREAVDRHSELALVDIESGAIEPIDGSENIVGPLAWAPHGEHLYFGQAQRSGRSIKIATYDVASGRLTTVQLPNLDLPVSFSQSTGTLVPWSGG
jgi:hypothetical protein